MHKTYAGKHRRLQYAIGRRVIGLLLAAFILPAFAQSTRGAAARTDSACTNPILLMGDSLAAGYGLDTGQGWAWLLADRLAQEKPDWCLSNASISGETSSGGAARIVDAVLRVHPRVVVIELGANDGLRGLPLADMRRNLAYMIGAAQSVHARVLLVGMRMPPNLGPDYTQGFAQTYADLAKQFHVALLPFLLEPVAADRANFQDDNMHPIAPVQPQILAHVWTKLGPLLK